MATSTCREKRVRRDMGTVAPLPLVGRSWGCPAHRSYRTPLPDPPPQGGREHATFLAIEASRLGERADQAGRLLHMAVQRLDQLVAGKTGRKRGRLQVGRHQREGVVMLRSGRGAGPEIVRQLHQAGAADIFVTWFADFTLGKAGDGSRDA